MEKEDRGLLIFPECLLHAICFRFVTLFTYHNDSATAILSYFFWWRISHNWKAAEMEHKSSTFWFKNMNSFPWPHAASFSVKSFIRIPINFCRHISIRTSGTRIACRGRMIYRRKIGLRVLQLIKSCTNGKKVKNFIFIYENIQCLYKGMTQIHWK